jgi:hypothetical protein
VPGGGLDGDVVHQAGRRPLSIAEAAVRTQGSAYARELPGCTESGKAV